MFNGDLIKQNNSNRIFWRYHTIILCRFVHIHTWDILPFLSIAQSLSKYYDYNSSRRHYRLKFENPDNGVRGEADYFLIMKISYEWFNFYSILPDSLVEIKVQMIIISENIRWWKLFILCVVSKSYWFAKNTVIDSRNILFWSFPLKMEMHLKTYKVRNKVTMWFKFVEKIARVSIRRDQWADFESKERRLPQKF